MTPLQQPAQQSVGKSLQGNGHVGILSPSRLPISPSERSAFTYESNPRPTTLGPAQPRPARNRCCNSSCNSHKAATDLTPLALQNPLRFIARLLFSGGAVREWK